MPRLPLALLLAACNHPDAAPIREKPCGEPTTLAPGLVASRVPLGSAGCIDVVRADPARFHLRVLTAARDGSSHPAPAWRETFHLAAVINAGMFHADGAPVGMIVEDGVAVSADNRSYAGYLAFDPRDAHDPPALLTGRDCDGFDLAALRARYRSLVQSSRLLGCDGRALPWADAKRYSAAAIGLDRAGGIVMLHARAGVTMTELSRALAASDLELAGALFLEGGPEASLVAKGEGGELARTGSFETGFYESDGNRAFWWLPNVLALSAVP